MIEKLKTFIERNYTFYLLLIGLTSALFFCVTFLLNRAISLDGGHWFWTGFLRVIYIVFMLSIILVLWRGFDYFKLVIKEYIANFIFWNIAGGIGFGLFYSLLCFSADFSPAWVVATTWQITIVSSLFVLHFFGHKLKKSVWGFAIMIFIGVSIVNLGNVGFDKINLLLLGFFPVLIASICYPLGNQLVWNFKKKRMDNNEDVKILNNAFVKIFLLTLGSVPIWIVIALFLDVGEPSHNQTINVFYVSVFSGLIATSLFLYARNISKKPSHLLLVDATQSAESVMTLFAEVIFLGALFPNFISIFGIFVTISGLLLIMREK